MPVKAWAPFDVSAVRDTGLMLRAGVWYWRCLCGATGESAARVRTRKEYETHRAQCTNRQAMQQILQKRVARLMRLRVDFIDGQNVDVHDLLYVVQLGAGWYKVGRTRFDWQLSRLSNYARLRLPVRRVVCGLGVKERTIHRALAHAGATVWSSEQFLLTTLLKQWLLKGDLCAPCPTPQGQKTCNVAESGKKF